MSIEIEVKKKFVVFVGPNRAGKSTMVESMIRQEPEWFSNNYKGNGLDTPQDCYDEFWNVLKGHVESPDRSTICDRLHFPDDLIYRKVMEGAESIPLEKESAGIQYLLRKIGALFIYVKANAEVLAERHERLEQHWHMKDVELFPKIIKAYDDFFENTNPSYLGPYQLDYKVIDTTSTDPEQAVDQAWRHISYHYQVTVPGRLKAGERLWI